MKNIKLPIKIASRFKYLFILIFSLIGFEIFATIAVTNIQHTTSGGCDGTIEILTTGTAGPFSIELYYDNDGTLEFQEELEDHIGPFTFTDLCSGNYTLLVDNQYSCEKVLEAELLVCEDFPFSISGDVIDVCFGQDAQISLSVSGGTDENYNFLWNDGAQTQNRSGLSEGLYSLTVTDGGGCTAEQSFEVESNYDPDFAIQINSTGCICPGGYGTIDIAVMGNSGPYTFQWTGEGNFSSAEEDVEVWEIGAYYVEIINVHGCVVNQDFDIGLCDFNFSNFQTNINHSCSGTNSGSINIEVNDIAESPYHFIWTNVEGEILLELTNETGYSVLEDLDAGTYFVLVVSANGCSTSSGAMNINHHDPPEITYVISPATSENSNDGAIDLTIDGDTGPYTVEWTGPNNYTSTDQDITDLDNGNYKVEVFFGNGDCSINVDIEVDICEDIWDDIDISSTVTPMSIDLNDGAIDLTIEGAAGYSLEFIWTYFATGEQFFTEDIAGLSAGKYCVKIRHPACPSIQEVLCFEICDFGFDIRFINYDDCNSTTIYTQINGENAPYTYQWSDETTNNSGTAIYGEEYCVTITDFTGCTAERCITVTPPSMELAFNVTNASYGNSNGSVSVNVLNGVFEPYTYSWSNDETGYKIVGLNPGQYCVTVTDDCGNEIIGCETVSCEISPSQVSADITNVACGASSVSGAIDLTVNLDDLPNAVNIYSWSNGATTEDISDLAAGDYSVTITNFPSNCVYTNTYTVAINGKGDFDFDFEIEAGCLGGNDGSITATVTGGAGDDYTYEWRQFLDPMIIGTTPSINNLNPSWYVLSAIDAYGCRDYGYAFLSPAENSLDFELEINPEVICQGETASVNVINITGGVGPFEYEWRQLYQILDGDESINGLGSGWYFVKVTDFEGCTREKAFQIDTYSQFDIDEKITNVCGDNLGSIALTLDGNAEPVTYSWSNGETTSEINDLEAGNYTVTVIDGNGCERIESYSIQQSSLPEVDASIIQPTCYGDENGEIELSPVSGGLPYTYEWSNGASANSIQNIEAGTYEVTVTNTYGCTNTFNYDLESPSAIEIIVNNVSPSTETPEEGEIPTGSISISVTGGISPYSYAWSGPNYSSTNEDISGLYNGNYTVTVTDANGCVESLQISICSNPSPMSVYINPFLTENCVAPNIGSINGLEIVGGTIPYTYSWSGPDGFTANTPQITNLNTEGEYCITVTDGCYQQRQDCVQLRCDCDPFYAYLRAIDPCGDYPGDGDLGGEDSQIKLGHIYPVTGTSPPLTYHIQWSTGDEGVITRQIGHATNEWDLISGVDELTEITSHTTYSVTITDENGCTTIPDPIYYVVGEPVVEVNLFPANATSNNTSNTSSENYGLGSLESLGYENLNFLCQTAKYCGSVQIEDPWTETIDWSALNFYPVNPSFPCFGGGTITCPFNDESLGIYVPPGQGQLVTTDNGDCGCVFPTGWTTENLNFPIFVSCDNFLYDDEDDDDGGPVGNGGGPIQCQGEWTYENDAENCAYDWFCDGNPEGSVPAYTLCVQVLPSTDFRYVPPQNDDVPDCQILIVEYCEVNECDGSSEFIPVHCNNSTVICGESTLNAILSDYGYPDLNCDNSETCCDDIYTMLPDCPVCFTNPDDSELGLQREQEWMQAFGLIDDLELKAFPNPFTNELFAKVNSPNSGQVNIKMLNILGEELLNLNYEVNKGSNTIDLSHINGLHTGVYQIIVSDDKGNYAIQKVVYQSE